MKRNNTRPTILTALLNKCLNKCHKEAKELQKAEALYSNATIDHTTFMNCANNVQKRLLHYISCITVMLNDNWYPTVINNSNTINNNATTDDLMNGITAVCESIAKAAKTAQPNEKVEICDHISYIQYGSPKIEE